MFFHTETFMGQHKICRCIRGHFFGNCLNIFYTFFNTCKCTYVPKRRVPYYVLIPKAWWIAWISVTFDMSQHIWNYRMHSNLDKYTSLASFLSAKTMLGDVPALMYFRHLQRATPMLIFQLVVSYGLYIMTSQAQNIWSILLMITLPFQMNFTTKNLLDFYSKFLLNVLNTCMKLLK